MNHVAIIFVVALGWASQYAPGVMEKVIPRQQRYGHLPAALPRVDGYVAVSDCRRLGEIIYLRPEEGEWETFLVADCAGSDATREWMRRDNILVEVDHQTVLRWNAPIGKGKRVAVGISGKLRIDRRR